MNESQAFSAVRWAQRALRSPFLFDPSGEGLL
jgi:hypothetical protein